MNYKEEMENERVRYLIATWILIAMVILIIIGLTILIVNLK